MFFSGEFLGCFAALLLTLAALLLSFPKKRRAAATASPANPSDASPSSTSQTLVPPPAAAAASDYEVFLSFRGKDVRTSFGDYLYSDLVDAGVRTFRDDDELPVGRPIAPELWQAISRSKICVPIFSKGYASSKWCLDELAHMAECRRSSGRLMILPIFFDVEPREVRHQSGDYAKAFRKHEKMFGAEVVGKWRKALNEVGASKGRELKNIANGHQGKVVKLVVSDIWRELKKASMVVSNNLVGIDTHVEEMIRLLSVDSSDVRIVGIHGMGGIGKTTIAKVTYNQLSERFDSCSFLRDVRETSLQHTGLVHLQNQLINNILKRKCQDISNVDEGIIVIKDRLCSKKALIVLDDVDQMLQLDALVGSRDWFGSGSRIIITTRNKDLLNVPEVDSTYEPKELDSDQSLQLFSKHAFRADHPPEDYITLAKDVSTMTSGLPLALEVIGSFLSFKRKAVWEDTIKKLKKIPNEQVRKKLEISYLALDHEQKQIFLDIACFFIGVDKRIAVHMWEDCNFFPENGLEVLFLMSLVKFGDGNELWMHDQLRDLGRELVREENYKEPWKRSRLWFHVEALDIIERRLGTPKVEALCLDPGFGTEEQCFSVEEFTALLNLRFLRVFRASLAGDFKRCFLQLRWLCWNGCPSSFSITNLHLKNLVILDLSWSKVAEGWEGWNQIKMARKLKVLNLTGCRNLISTPNFSAYPTLERLILEDCENLVHIDPSIGRLKSLLFLDMRKCTRLSLVPPELGSVDTLTELLIDETSIQEVPVCRGLMKKLETLSVSSCASLTQICSSIGQLTSLSNLTLDFAQIKELPESIGMLIKLQKLSLRSCLQLRGLPESIGKLESLVELRLLAARVAEVPCTIGNLKNLKVLEVNYTKIEKFPISLGMLEKLEELDASHCYNLEGHIPASLIRLSSLRILKLDCTKILSLPLEIGGLSHLESLELVGCRELQSLPELPSSLKTLHVTCVSMEPFTQLLNLTNLKELWLSNCFKLAAVPNGMDRLSRLEDLEFYQTNIRVLPTSIGDLPRLRKLYIQGCEKLELLPQLPPNLYELRVEVCEALRVLPSLSNLKVLANLSLAGCLELTEIEGLDGLEQLTSLDVSECEKLLRVDGIENLESLRYLNVSKCGSMERLPDLTNLKNLQKLVAYRCKKLIEIPGLDKLASLEKLFVSCVCINKLPDLSNLGMLKSIELVQCEELQEIPGLEVLHLLRRVKLSLCISLERLPDLSKLRNLKDLEIKGCKKLTDVLGLGELKLLEFLDISECSSLRRLPDLSHVKVVKR